MTEIEFNIGIKCRACLTEEQQMYDLFDTLDELQDNLTLGQILDNTTNVKVRNDDGLSSYLCKKCAEIIVDFYNFKSVFIENEKYLRSLLPDKHFEDILVSDTQPTNVSSPNSVHGENIKYEVIEDQGIEIVKNELCNIAEKNFSADLLTVNLAYQNQPSVPREDRPEVSVVHQIAKIEERTKHFCVLCGSTFIDEACFRFHIYSSHKKTLDTIDCSQYSLKVFKVPRVSSEAQTECTRCNIIFDTAEELVAHNKTHRNFVCQVCGAAFTKSSILADHKIIHETSARYVCSYCGKDFKRRFQFALHKRAHTDPGAFKCEKCGKAFNSNQQLKSHFQLIHIRARPYLCNLCGLTFPLRSTLRTHQRRKHTAEVGATRDSFQCSFCDVVYKNKTTLTRHISTKHDSRAVKPRCHLCDKAFSDSNNIRKHLMMGRCRQDVLKSDKKLIIDEKKRKAKRVPKKVQSESQSL